MSATDHPPTVRASAYLVIKGVRKAWGPLEAPSGLRRVETAQIAALRQLRPTRLSADEIAIRVAVEVPAAAFDPIVPEALVIVPEALVLARHHIDVTATDDPEYDREGVS